MQAGYAAVSAASFCVKSKTHSIKVTEGPLSAEMLT